MAGSVPGLSTIPFPARNTRSPSAMDTVTSLSAVIFARSGPIPIATTFTVSAGMVVSLLCCPAPYPA
jgi:hypothetical protein